MIIQKLRCKTPTSLVKAERYFQMVSVVNDLRLTERDVQFVAFLAVEKEFKKKEFCEKYNTSMATVGNIIHKLKKLRVLRKENGKLLVHPHLSLNFENDITLNIVLNG
jgi:predicted transcriptional regulator